MWPAPSTGPWHRVPDEFPWQDSISHSSSQLTAGGTKHVLSSPWGGAPGHPAWFLRAAPPAPLPSADSILQFSSGQSLSCVRLFVTPWTATCQASLSITNSRSSLKLTSIESVMPSNHLILCRPLLLLPSIFPSIRVFSSESALYTRWWKYWSFNFSITPSSEYSGLIPLG